MGKRFKIEMTSASLHIMAMAFMLLDHLWATVIPGNDWMTCIGRLAFPIFAFMIAEGCLRTRSIKKYALRMLIFAVISEIPFNLAFSGRIFYPTHQNVLWTFLIAIMLVWLNEKAREKNKLWLTLLTGAGSILIGAIVGIVTMVDYHHVGVLTVLVFYFFHDRKWWCYLAQLVCLVYMNFEMLGGLGYELEIFGKEFFLVRQGLAVFALAAIWLYRGKKGYQSRVFKYVNYAFYPGHLVILWVLALILR